MPLCIQLQGIESSSAVCADAITEMTDFFQWFPVEWYESSVQLFGSPPSLDLFTMGRRCFRYVSTDKNIAISNIVDNGALVEATLPVSECGQLSPWVESKEGEPGDPNDLGELDVKWNA